MSPSVEQSIASARYALSRNFSIASLILTMIVAAALSWSHQFLALRDLTHLAEDRNVALTQAFSNSLWPRFSPLLAASPHADSLRMQAERDGLQALATSQMANTEVIKIKIYGLNGLTLFSSDPTQTGENKSDNAAYLAALAGQVTSGMTHRDKFDTFEGVRSDLDVISTYLPIYDEQKQLAAVFEIYSDVSDLVTQIETTRSMVGGVVLALLGLLYLLQYIFVARAQGVIDRQSAMLRQSIEELDERVRARTEALDASNGSLMSEVIERKRIEETLRESTARYRAITQSSNEAIITADSDGNVVGWNLQAEAFFGYTEEEVLGQSLALIIPERFRTDHWRGVQRAHEGHPSRVTGKTLVLEGLRKDRSEFPIELSLASWEIGDKRYVSGTIRDLTEKRQAEHHLRVAAATFETKEGVAITDANQCILRVNRSFTEITGYDADEVIGKTPRVLSSGRQDKAFYAAMWESILRTGNWQGEIWNRRKNGEVYPEWLNVTAVKAADGVVTNYVGTFSDITERKASESEIALLAFYDPLTGLPNRRLLLDRLKQRVSSNTRRSSCIAVLFIDLDNFKTLNDTLGHDIGDQLLREVGHRLSSCVRDGDTVARLGGDEFVVLIEDLEQDAQTAASQVELIGEKILLEIVRPYQLAAIEHHCSASVGVTLMANQQVTADDLMKQADLAMYQAKAGGRNTLRFFDPDMQAAISRRALLEDGLRRALEAGQFRLYYQGQVDRDGRLTGVEALLRWCHPERGMVSPLDFIPLAEESGLILPIGDWVLENACQLLVKWAQRPEMAHLTVAVNVSARQFQQRDFVTRVLMAIDSTGANPQRLKLELTESLLVNNVEDIIRKILTLRRSGIGFSLDDFGTGYSSLTYLKRLPLDQLKIDQSFVRNILRDPNDAAIAKTIVALANSLGLSVIAEGVETQAQKDLLADHGCLAYQGYLFYRPVPIEEFEDLPHRF